jgi:hypothetical protein
VVTEKVAKIVPYELPIPFNNLHPVSGKKILRFKQLTLGNAASTRQGVTVVRAGDPFYCEQINI